MDDLPEIKEALAFKSLKTTSKNQVLRYLRFKDYDRYITRTTTDEATKNLLTRMST